MPRGAKPAASNKGANKTTGKAQQTPRQRQAARIAQQTREAQQHAARQRARTATRGGRASGRSTTAGRQKGPLRGWRSWWATYEMDRQARQAAGGRLGGGRVGTGPILGPMGLPRAVTVFTLLTLAAFTGSIALGAKSFVTAVIAFLFLAGAIAVATASRASRYFRSRPARTRRPLETTSDFGVASPTTATDDPTPGDVYTLDDLDRSLHTEDEESAHRPTRAIESPPARSSPPAEPPAATLAAREPICVDSHGMATSTTEPTIDADWPDDVDWSQPPEADGTVTPDSPADDPAVQSGTGTTDGDLGADTVDPEAPEPTSDRRDITTAAPAASPPDDATAPTVEPETTTRIDPTVSPVTESSDSTPPRTGTSLTLLAAETPGHDLLAAYSASDAQLPPEAVRDVATTLIVSDLDRSIMFYTELLGLVEIDRARDAVLLEAGFGRVLLWERDDAPDAGDPAMHLTFEVGDIDAAYRMLRAKGVVFTHAPRSALSGEVHDLKAASFLDPDGHGLAITELRAH